MIGKNVSAPWSNRAERVVKTKIERKTIVNINTDRSEYSIFRFKIFVLPLDLEPMLKRERNLVYCNFNVSFRQLF